MRPDMNKLLCERPRYGEDYSKFGNKNTLLEDLPTKESMRKPYGGRYGRGKQLNDYLAPLRRFLESKVGSLWDDVYSEIRANINPNSTVQQHVLEHIFGYVEINVQYIDGVVYSKPPYPSRIGDGEMYVDSEGYLRCTPNRKRRWKKTLKSCIKISETQVLDNIDGVWYRVYVGYGRKAVVFDYGRRERGWSSWTYRRMGDVKTYGPEITKETVITKNIYTEMKSLVSRWKNGLSYLEGEAKKQVERKIQETERILSEFKNVNERKTTSSTPIYKVGYEKRQLSSAELKKYGLKNN